MTPDPFGTAALRAAVLGAWRASPARLREDANVEEDHARGYYRDRVLVELAQNAADAAVRAGVPGRLLLRLAHTDAVDERADAEQHAPSKGRAASDRTPASRAVLVAANTGAPLDAAGVASLAAMRASSKRDGDGLVGRFGVGFAAVRAVSDEVSVLSSAGGVRFSLADSAALLAEASAHESGLADEVRRRDGSLPALRLPLPAQGRPPVGYDTAVVLQLRDEVAFDEVATLLAAVDDLLLLALPGLVEVVVEQPGRPSRRLADVADRWLVRRAEGDVPLDLMAARPVEERASRRWRVTLALPRTDLVTPASQGLGSSATAGSSPGGAARVLYAPTATDESLDLPVVVVATLPLDPTRRHVVRGPLADAVLDHVAATYAALAHHVALDGGDALALVPTGLAAGDLDAALRERILAALTTTPLLAPAEAGEVGESARGGDVARDDRTPVLVAPGRAAAVDGAAGRDPAVLEALAGWVGGLVTVPVGRQSQARALGVELRPLADVVDELPAVPDARWPVLYAALAPLADDSRDREALAGLPVPLADGRVVRGARGTLLVDPDVAARLDATGPDTLDTLVRLGLRLVDPSAAHPLLERLGARAADAAALLLQPVVREAVLAQADDDDPDDDVTDAVLALVAAAGDVPRDTRPWLGLLTLVAADGEPTPADGLVVPGSPAARLLDDRVLAPVALELVDRWGAGTLTAAGVRADLVVVHVPDVLVDLEPADGASDEPAALAAQSLDGWDDYLDHLADALGAGAYVGDLVAVADLDAVADGAWPEVLERIAGSPELRRALLDPVRGEGGATASSYTAWWLRENAGLGLGGPFLVGDDPALAHLLPAAPEAVAGRDPQMQRALGGIEHAADLDGVAWTRLLDAWRVGTPVEPSVAVVVWRHAHPDAPPEHVPALVGADRLTVVHAQDAAVADGPMWWQRTDVAAIVPCVTTADAQDVGHRLDLPLTSAIAAGHPDEPGAEAAVPPAAAALLPGAPRTWREHDELTVDGAPVTWWVDEDGVVHAASTAGLAAGLAQAAGRWTLRATVELALADPARVAELTLDTAWSTPTD